MFQTGYNFVELAETALRRRQDRNAIVVPGRVVGLLDLLRSFRQRQIASWDYGVQMTVLGVEQLLLASEDPMAMARHIHDEVLYDPAVYDRLGKLDATLVFACDGAFAVGPSTFELRIGQVFVPLGILFINQPRIVEKSGRKLGYWAPFKLSG